MKTLLTRISAIVLLFACLTVAPLSPAGATTVDPGGGMTCNQTSTHTQPTSTTVRITITLKCWGTVTGLENNVSYQRSGKYDSRGNNGCTNKQLDSPFSCTITHTMTDPAGSQKFEAMNEWTIWIGIGPYCQPHGDFPDCDTQRKDGIAFIDPFYS